MAISLYDATVAGFIQGLTGLEGVMKIGLDHYRAAGLDPEEVVTTKLCGDMLPFRYQVLACTHHSVKAIEGVKQGLFIPSRELPPDDYATLQGKVSKARVALEAMAPEEINALEGRDVEFRLGEMSLPFTAEAFLLSFSVPNFHFHATTAYDILRWRGAPLGKKDFLGRLRIKR